MRNQGQYSNHFRLEMFKYLMNHTSSPLQKTACIKNLPMNGLLDFSNNLISFAAQLETDQSVIVRESFNAGMPYMISLQDYTPLDYSRKLNMLTTNIILDHLRIHGKFQKFQDLTLFIENYKPSWASSYMFKESDFCFDAKKKCGERILGKIRWGQGLIYSSCQQVSTMDLNRCINFKSKKMQIIKVQSFNIQLNMDVGTTQCHQLLSLFKYSSPDLFLSTQLGLIIDNCFNESWKLIFFFNQVYFAQTLFLTMFEVGESEFSKIMTLITVVLIMAIECLQLGVEGASYFGKFFNWFNMIGNMLVALRMFEILE